MRANETQESWATWRDEELMFAREYLLRKHFLLDDEQAHVSGERFLVSGRKLVLAGRREGDGLRVIIKWSRTPEGRNEIRDEHRRRAVLSGIHFRNRTIRSPKEVYFEDSALATILASEFIPQEKIFLQFPTTDQFFFALSALESQEGTHVATREHEQALLSLGTHMGYNNYLRQFDEWEKDIRERAPDKRELHQLLRMASEFLHEHRTSIERYCGVLTHTDFVPHNLRIMGRELFTIDETSLIIGNKYESWARFINFMALYNPELERLLSQYVQNNRNADEYVCLRAMRLFKLGFLLRHHIMAHDISEGDLHLLTGERIVFWTHVLESVLRDETPDPSAVAHYKSRAIALRSPEETRRHQDISGWK